MVSSYTFAIGDLHGRFDLLKLAVDEAKRVAGEIPATFVVCGDFVDRGPQSKQIIDYLMLMTDAGIGNMKFVVVKGNHEDMMVRVLMFPTFSRIINWEHNGGLQTLASYGYKKDEPIHPRKIPDEHVYWLHHLPYYYVDKHRAFVHAGFDPQKSLDDQDVEYMMWIMTNKHQDYKFGDKYVVHGHMQYKDGPIILENRINLDTFAWYSGRLALAVFDDATPGKPVNIKIIEA